MAAVVAGGAASVAGVADGLDPAGGTDEDAGVEKYVWGAGDVVWQAPAVADPTVDKYVWDVPDLVWDKATLVRESPADLPLCSECGEPITFAGKPCGASHISSGKTCRVGAGGSGPPTAARIRELNRDAMRNHRTAEPIGRLDNDDVARLSAEISEWETRSIHSPERTGSSIRIGRDAVEHGAEGGKTLMSRSPSGELTGMIAFDLNPRNVHVYDVTAAPTEAGRGAGRRLVYEVAEKAYSRRGPIDLAALSAAVPFYESLGFRRTDANLPGSTPMRMDAQTVEKFVKEMRGAK